MDDGVGPRVGQDGGEQLRVAQIALHEVKRWLAAGPVQVRLFCRPVVERIEVVQPPHRLAVFQQALDQVRSDKAGGAGDEHTPGSFSCWHAWLSG